MTFDAEERQLDQRQRRIFCVARIFASAKKKIV